MNLIIEPLTLGLTADYLDFFDHRAFSDGNPCGPCYCTGPSMDVATERQMVSEFGGNVKAVCRRYAVSLLAEGKIHGYLAFDDGKAIAWCNAGNMDDYVSRIPDVARKNACGKTMAVVCFAIAPAYRGMGVATAFLEHVISDASRDGYRAVEGYAKVRNARVYHDYNGPMRLYQKAGFVEVARFDDIVVMRREL